MGPGPPLYHYIIVRSDLPRGYQAAQIAHAAGESVTECVPTGTHVVVLSVPDEDALWDVHSELVAHSEIPPGVPSSRWNGPHTVIHDPDPPRGWKQPWGIERPGLKRSAAGEATAIGVPPTRDRRWLRRALGRLPLLK